MIIELSDYRDRDPINKHLERAVVLATDYATGEDWERDSQHFVDLVERISKRCDIKWREAHDLAHVAIVEAEERQRRSVIPTQLKLVRAE